MPKFTLQPERVLSPEMTADFERLISVLERPDFIDVLRQITSDAVTNAATAASVSSGATAPAPEVNVAAAASGPSTAFDPNNTGYDDTYYNDTVARGGVEGANAWLARQDFGPQIRTWGINALKEIGGEFASPLGWNVGGVRQSIRRRERDARRQQRWRRHLQHHAGIPRLQRHTATVRRRDGTRCPPGSRDTDAGLGEWIIDEQL